MSIGVDVNIAQAVEYAIHHGYQVSPNAIKLLKSAGEKLEGPSSLDFLSVISLLIEEKGKFVASTESARNVPTITDQDLIGFLPKVFENTVIMTNSELASKEESDIEVIFDPSVSVEQSMIGTFALLFRSRYEKFLRIFGERPEARQLTKISEQDMGQGVSRISGLVLSKRASKFGIELTLDDTVGKLNVVAMSDDSRKAASDIMLDQGIMVEVVSKSRRLAIKSLVQPDLPIRVPVGSHKDVYAIFLSDLHIGSNRFLASSFSRFLEWVNGRGLGNSDDGYILSHLKYVIIAGDIVDGVGVFPNQEYELAETDILKQYVMVAEKLKEVPDRLAVVVIPGNHDSTRQALPQPRISAKYAEPVYQLRNVTMLGDPCVVRLSGVSVLVYHGRSLDDVLATTASTSYNRPAEAMKILLKARHLAPMFGSRTPIAPESEDRLVIEDPPDIFHAGHVHTIGVESYRGTLILNSGTWQAQTSYQANL
ncbi:MAG: metallophosphoesterase, partial [Nitrososphaerales archaeon]